MTPAPEPGTGAALAAWAATCRWEDVPEAVRHQARRCLVNLFACALAGRRDEAVRIASRVFATLGPAGDCVVIGEKRTAGLLHAASLNAMAANVHDFDDTHVPTILHPTAPVAPVLLALAHTQRMTGAELLHALVIGIEVECRIALAVSPAHYTRGWHITSTCGIFGAALAAGRVLGLNAQQMLWALGNASAQAGGLVETLGTMAKSAGVGHAASGGLTSALLAREGFAGPPQALEGPRGFLRVFGEGEPRLDTNSLGREWKIQRNAFKPYPCGVVLNPVIDACLALHAALPDGLPPLERIELRGNPLLRQRTDRPGVTSGKLSQVCAQHAVAMALTRGRAGLAEFSDEAVRDPASASIGNLVRFIDDDSMHVEEAEVRLVRSDGGSTLLHHVPAARGSLAAPLSDDDLTAKFTTQAADSTSGIDASALVDALWKLDAGSDVADLMRLARGRNAP
jgi:2-methylcitrate dehydratase PrpD